MFYTVMDFPVFVKKKMQKLRQILKIPAGALNVWEI
jgi:hypothetical protein